RSKTVTKFRVRSHFLGEVVSGANVDTSGHPSAVRIAYSKVITGIARRGVTQENTSVHIELLIGDFEDLVEVVGTSYTDVNECVLPASAETPVVGVGGVSEVRTNGDEVVDGPLCRYLDR